MPEADQVARQGEEVCHVLAVDLGTGGPKVALVSPTGRVVASAFRPVRLNLIAGGGAEQDPAEWWSAVVAAAREVLGAPAGRPGRVVGLGCTAQWSGTVAVDREGMPVRPAVIWMDSRGSAAIRRQSGGRVSLLGYDLRKVARWIRLTGGAPGQSGKDPTAHILWIREAEPDAYEATYKFLEPVDWLNQRLTGSFRASYDSIAAHWVTDNRKVRSVHYDATLMAMAGLEAAKLPDLVAPATVMGHLRKEAADELGLPPGLPVATGTGDLHSAAVGSGAVADFDAHLYIGTSSWISCHVPFKKTDPLHNIASIPAAVPGRYLVADEHETAGACLEFLRDSIIYPDDALATPVPDGADVYRLFDEMAASVVPGSGGVLFTPWLNGERSPVDDHTIRGGFHNLSLGITRAEMVRAVYEGVAFNSLWLLEAVERFCSRRMDTLTFIGGGANSGLWCQIHADVMGRKIRQAAEPVLANVRGAAMLAWLALGRVRVEDLPTMSPAARTYVPSADPADRRAYGEMYAEFVNMYKATKAIYRRLNGS